MADDLALLAVDYLVIEHVDADLVVIPRLVRRVLKVPDQLAGIDVERHRRVGVEVVAGARLGIVLRHRIACAPDGESGRGVVGAGLPQPAATGLPGVVLVLPGLAAGLARLRDRIPAPELVAGARIERGHPAAGAAVTGAVGDEHFSLDRHRRGRKPFLVAELVGLGDFLVPDDLARITVERDHAAVRQVADHQVFPERNAARLRPIAFVADAGILDPDELALVRIARIDLINRAPAVAGIHEAVVDERIDLVFWTVLPDILHATQRQRPHHPQIFHVFAIDLGEPGIAL